jgi:disulfide bond formation protein DsbB
MKEVSLLRLSWGVSCFAVFCSFVYEYYFGVEPCYLCLQQRYLMVGLSAFLFPVWAHIPFFQILSAGCASIGINVAYEHVMLQDTPFDAIPSLLLQLPDSIEGFADFFTFPVASLIGFTTIFLLIVCSTIRKN